MKRDRNITKVNYNLFISQFTITGLLRHSSSFDHYKVNNNLLYIRVYTQIGFDPYRGDWYEHESIQPVHVFLLQYPWF